jgi:hypothetical protein
MREAEDPIFGVSEEVLQKIEQQERDETSLAWETLFEKFVAIAKQGQQDVNETSVMGMLFIDGHYCDVGLIVKPYFCNDEGQPELLVIDLTCNQSQKEPNPGRGLAYAIWDDEKPQLAEAEGHFSDINDHEVSLLDVVNSAIKAVDYAAINLEATIIPDGMVFPLPKEILRPGQMN